MEINYFSIIGWISMAFLLAAYFMISFKKIKPKSKTYYFLNFLGSTGLLITSFYSRLFPVAVLNLFWMIISLFFLVKLFKIKPVYRELK
jgi:FtsH-binding integral membrane protein